MISATNFYIVILSAMMIQKCVVLSNRAETYFLFAGVEWGGGGYDYLEFPRFTSAKNGARAKFINAFAPELHRNAC